MTLLAGLVLLASLPASAQRVYKPRARPVAVVEKRLAALESELVALRGIVSALEKTVTPLEGLERCVRVFEDELGGLPGPHILFTRCNVHVRSGELATDAPVNGLGNLVVGYNARGVASRSTSPAVRPPRIPASLRPVWATASAAGAPARSATARARTTWSSASSTSTRATPGSWPAAPTRYARPTQP